MAGAMSATGYMRFANDKAGTNTRFAAEIIDVSRGGNRYCDWSITGAIAFILPVPARRSR